MILDVIFTYFQKEVCLYSQQLPDHLLLPSNKNYLKEKGTTMVWFSEKHMLCSLRSHYTIVLLIGWGRGKELSCGPSQGCDFPLICSGNATHCPRLFIQLCVSIDRVAAMALSSGVTAECKRHLGLAESIMTQIIIYLDFSKVH